MSTDTGIGRYVDQYPRRAVQFHTAGEWLTKPDMVGRTRTRTPQTFYLSVYISARLYHLYISSPYDHTRNGLRTSIISNERKPCEASCKICRGARGCSRARLERRYTWSTDSNVTARKPQHPQRPLQLSNDWFRRSTGWSNSLCYA